MRTALPKQAPPAKSHRPRAVTVFAAAFVAGAAAAVGVNRALDVRLAQAKPRVETESIFVALRSLPQGAAVTVWDVALREWPKAMMPATALRASDTFSGRLLKHPLREGQPLLSIQLLPSGQASQPAAEASPSTPPTDYTRGTAPVVPAADADLWAPAEPIKVAVLPPAHATVAAPQPVPSQPVVTQATQPQPAFTQPAVNQTQAAPAAPQPSVTQTPAPEAVTPAEVAAPAEEVAAQPSVTEIATSDVAGDTASTDPDMDPISPIPTEEAVAAAAPDVAVDATEPSAPNDPAPSQVPEPAPADESTVTAEDVPAPIAAEPTAPAAPTAAARPVHGRYLVVPESIALKADTSFVNRADAQRQEAEPAPGGKVPAAAETVRPLPTTTTAGRSPQSASPRANAPQGRSPQRQGRQSPSTNVPGNNGRPTGGQPSRQPRFGNTIFPNLSAGMNAIDGRLRGNQPEQGEADATGAVTAR